jgi:5'-methylthioadenosine phosphorylase
VQMIPAERGCGCGSALAHAVITDKSAISAEARLRLDLLLGRYLA